MPSSPQAAPSERTNGDPIRVVTVDDFAPFLDLARDVIDAAPGFEAVREVASGQEALEAAAALEPELMLVDVRMPAMSGIEVAHALRTAHPRMVIVLISSHDVADLSADARTCGADAVVGKQQLSPELLGELWRQHAPARDA